MSGEGIIAVRQAGRRYGRTNVLANVSFTIDRPEIVGVVGPNGAGKTTLLRTIVGLLRPTEGTVVVGGREPPAALRHFQVAYFAGEASMSAIARAGRWASLFGVPLPDARRIGVLSRGTRQWLGVSATLACRARLYVLDEPWEGLDPDASRSLARMLVEKRTKGAAVLLTSHRLYDLAGVCDRYAFLVSGSLVCLSPAQVAPEGSVTGGHLLEVFDRLRGGRA